MKSSAEKVWLAFGIALGGFLLAQGIISWVEGCSAGAIIGGCP